MLEAAGEVADGAVIHPFHSVKFLSDYAVPALSAGRARRSSDIATDFRIDVQVLVATGATDGEWSAAREAVRAQIAFYASTPAYRPVLEACGRQELQGELRSLTKQGRWSEMAALVSDDIVQLHAIDAEPEAAGRELRRRYEGIASRVAIATPMLLGADAASALVRGFKEEDRRIGAARVV